jgi:hypothetical protein
MHNLSYNVFRVKRDSPQSKDMENNYNGVCIDTGTERTVIGLKQAQAYCKLAKRPFRTIPNDNVYLFGEDRRLSMGSIPIRIPTSCRAFIEVIADVVTADIPFLLGLDPLRKFGIDVCLSTDQLKFTDQKWNVNTEQRHGHLYISESNLVSVLYTKSELIKLLLCETRTRIPNIV